MESRQGSHMSSAESMVTFKNRSISWPPSASRSAPCGHAGTFVPQPNRIVGSLGHWSLHCLGLGLPRLLQAPWRPDLIVAARFAMSRQSVIPQSRKKPRPPATGKGTPIMVRLQPDALARLDAWAHSQDDKPSRPEALRRLAERGLSAREPDAAKPRRSAKRGTTGL
jgi:hypothetical protein